MSVWYRWQLYNVYLAAVLVMLPKVEMTFTSGFFRAIGTIIGALTGPPPLENLYPDSGASGRRPRCSCTWHHPPICRLAHGSDPARLRPSSERQHRCPVDALTRAGAATSCACHFCMIAA